MTPIYKKTFDSPLLEELLRLTQKEWMKLKSIDITQDEYFELLTIFNDPEYNKEKFNLTRVSLLFNKVNITIDGQIIFNSSDDQKSKSWYKKI